LGNTLDLKLPKTTFNHVHSLIQIYILCVSSIRSKLTEYHFGRGIEMNTCEFCHTLLPPQAVFCSQCGSRRSIPGEISLGASTERNSTGQINENATVLSDISYPISTPLSKPSNSQLPTYGNISEADAENEILHPFEDGINDIYAHTIPPVNYIPPKDAVVQEQQEEEDDDEGNFVPLPLPFTPAGGNVPLAQGKLFADAIPSANAPHVYSSLMGEAATPPPPTPSTPTPPPPPAYGSPQPGNMPTTPAQQPVVHHPHPSQQLHKPHPAQHLRPSCLITIIVVLLLGSITAMVLITLSVVSPQQSSPNAWIVNHPAPGDTIFLRGVNFTPNETITITVDAQATNAEQNSSTAYLNNSMSISSAFTQARQRTSHALADQMWTIKIGPDGSFNLPVPYNPAWQATKTHKFYIFGSDNKLMKALPFTYESTVVNNPTKVANCENTSDTISLGSILEGSKQPIKKVSSICTVGSGPVKWSAKWDQSWLKTTPGGMVTAPGVVDLPLQASIGSLKPGAYTAHLTFSSANGQVQQKVILVVLKRNTILPLPSAPPPQPLVAPRVSCVNVAPQALSFTAIANERTTLQQTIQLNNCGDSAYWSSSTGTNNGGHWLGTGASKGTLPVGKLQLINITASSTYLREGQYTGQIKFSIGDSSSALPVTLTVLPAQTKQLCISSSTRTLDFYSNPNQGDPAPQYITLINCGGAGHWSSSLATDDGTNWLNVNPSSHFLERHGTQRIGISVSSALLDAGRYSGEVTLAMGSSIVTIHVNFHVATWCMYPSPQFLRFSVVEGATYSQSKSITLTNCGDPNEWYGAPLTRNGKGWLDIDRHSGKLGHRPQQVTVNVSAADLKHGTYAGEIIFAIGFHIVSVKVSLVVLPPDGGNHFCLGVNTNKLTFYTSGDQGSPLPQTIYLSNCGSKGTWTSETEDWIRLTPHSAVLDGDDVDEILVAPILPDTRNRFYSGTITFHLGTALQQVRVELNVRNPQPKHACIGTDQPSLSFTGYGNTDTSGQSNAGISSFSYNRQTSNSGSIRIHNCGDDGHWRIQGIGYEDSSLPAWLNVSPKSGFLSRDGWDTLAFNVNYAKLGEGTYGADVPVTIVTDDNRTATIRIDVTLTIVSKPDSPHKCTVSPSSLTFNSKWGEDAPGTRSITISGCRPFDRLNEWEDSGGIVFVGLGDGTVDRDGSHTFSVGINPSRGDAGQHNYTLTFSSSSGDIITVPIIWNMEVKTSRPCIEGTASSLHVSLNVGERKTIPFNFRNCGPDMGRVQVSGSGGSGWLTLNSGGSPIDGSGSYATGDGPGVSALCDATNMAPGQYRGSITAHIDTGHGVMDTNVPVLLDVLNTNPAQPTTINTPPKANNPDGSSPFVNNTPTVTPGAGPTATATDTPGATATVGSDSTTPTGTAGATATDTPTIGSGKSAPIATNTPTAIDTPTPTTAVATDTPTPPTPTPTTAVATDTPTPPTPTPTTAAATDTPTPPTPTPTTAAPTDTPVPPTPTPTPVPPTPTPVPPTPTPVPPTPTPVPSTPTPVPPTPTPVPPTPTPIPPTPTPIPPTPTPTVTPTDTPTGSPTSSG
jgi:Viral BACON domain